MTATVLPLLSPTQQRLLTFIRAYAGTNGYAPSMREISDGISLSLSAVNYQIGQLHEKGWIRRAPNRPRALVVLNPANGSDQ